MEILGEGGMAVVYKLWQPELERWVALKRCKNPQDLPAFQQEARLMASLKHPALAQIHALQHDQLIMEYIPGQTLRQAQIDAQELLEQLLDVLEYLHGENVILKDLKPENIMVQPDGRVKVLDLGIAKRMEQGTQLLLKGVGSEFYSPPEQYGHGSTDQRSDFYSLGATLYFCLTGKDPSPAWERMSKGISLDAPGPLGHLIEELTQLNPHDRPADVKAIRRLLRPVPPKERPRPPQVELQRERSYPQAGLLAWNEEGLWLGNQGIVNLETSQRFGQNFKVTRLIGQGHRLALTTKDRLMLRDKAGWKEHKASLKDLAFTPKDLLVLTNHLELQAEKRRFATGWGKRYSHCAADETHVAAGGPGLKVWDRGGAPLWEDHHPTSLLAFRGPFLLTSHQGSVCVFQADTGQRLLQIKTPDFQQIHLTDRHLIGVHDNHISVWDFAQGIQLLQVDLPSAVISSALGEQLAVSTTEKVWVLRLIGL
ncbi:MAG: serine/threonine-protein kinase [Vulcanimicrobiota bacterium]